MDTEKYIEIEHKVSMGKSPNDEGPYYHHGWWESYKGSVKGKLFGAVAGTMVGAAIGVAVAAAALMSPALAALGPIGTLGIIGVFAGGGLMYAMHEFSDIGKIAGSTAAQFYQKELRDKTFIKGQVAELKEEINEVKSLLKGEPVQKSEQCQKEIALAAEEETNYRKSHYAKLEPVKFNSLAFWKIAGIGLLIGAAVGAVLSIGGPASIAAVALEHVGIAEATIHALGSVGITAASMLVMGATGASFGLNRDFFRRLADKTDLLFKGVLRKREIAAVREDQIDAGEAIIEKLNGKAAEQKVIAEPSGIEYPKSETHFRDKVMPAAQRALLSFDHTRATPQ